MSAFFTSFSPRKQIAMASSYRGKSLFVAGVLSAFIVSCGSGGSDQQQDPLVISEPVAYVKRPVPRDENDDIVTDNIFEPAIFRGGAKLFIRDSSSSTSDEINITDALFEADAIYDVKDLESSFDGTKLIFSMRAPQIENADEEDQPKWNLWEYDLDSNSLSEVITDPIRSGEYHDISPAYLPDGRIVFASNRQVRSRAILLDEGKSGFAATTDDEEIFNLHVYDPNNDPNGSNIQQITFSQGHDLQPTVLSDGRIAFLRSDMGDQRDRLSIYTINQDGSDLRILYGYHSQSTGNTSNNETTFIDLRELPDGSLSAILQARDSSTFGGDLIQINSAGFTDINQPTIPNSGDTEPGQQSISVGDVNLDNNISTHGYFNSAYPIIDGENSLRFLVSWNPCRLRDPIENTILVCNSENLANPDLEAAEPFFGLWLYDVDAGTQNPLSIAQEGEIFTDVVLMKDVPLPLVAETTIDTELANRGVGALHIRSVYDTDGNDTSPSSIAVLADPTQTPANARPARFLRFIKPASIPSEDVYDFDNAAFGLSQNRGMKEILGYAPIEPDGSVLTEVPADVAYYFDVVDINGERIAPIHRNLLQVKAGETYQCIGCHTDNSEVPHGRLDAEFPSINTGAFAVGVHFPNTKYSNVTGVEDRDSMAEVFAKATAMGSTLSNGPRTLNNGMRYTDDWSEPALNADYNLVYEGDANFGPLISAAPTDAGCIASWQSNCRIVINYVDHIQPIWDASRVTNSCITCHSTTDNAGAPQQPAGQLELTSQPSAAEALHYTSYRELLQQGIPIIINPDGTAFLPLFVLSFINGVQQFYLDVDGNQILDANGNPIPQVRAFSPGDDNPADILLQTFTGNVVDLYLDINGDPILDANNNPIEVRNTPINPNDIPPPPVMRLSNAAGSRFFDKLEGTAGTVDHSSFMSPNELRLLREWLDIGGQYYNNPLDAPLD